jgi:ribulose-phosphate 3-epimerase
MISPEILISISRRQGGYMAFKPSVSPSLLAADFADLGNAALRAEAGGAGSIHLDYMDGHYVPNISFGIDLIPALKKRVGIPLIAHLMLSNAPDRLDDFMQAKPDCIILQEDAVRNPLQLIERIRSAEIIPGIAINPPRDLKKIRSLLPHIDYLLIMSVNPGFGGQKFIEDTLLKMEEAHRFRVEHGLHFDIAVDGGVNIYTAKSILETGANVLIAGTAVFGKDDMGEAIRSMLTPSP